jgi:hypothetical protein
MTMSRSRRWIAGVSLTLVALLVVFVVFFDWNLLRAPIAERVSKSTGRSFAINGDLSVRLGLRPRVVANDIVIGNAAWGREPAMAQIRRVDFRIDLLQLLIGRLVFPEIALSEPRLALEVGADGKGNWIFNERGEGGEFPVIGELSIDRGSAVYRDAKSNTDLALVVKTLANAAESGKAAEKVAEKTPGKTPEKAAPFGLEVTGKGRFKGMPTTFHAQGGALLSLRSDQAYPIAASAVLGTTKASIDGMLFDPLQLKGQSMNFSIEGSDLALLFPIIGVPIPPTPAYKLAGFLDHRGERWSFQRFTGRVGESDLAGDFSVDRAQRPQKISAELVSKQLRLQDLGGFIGADRGAQPSRSPPPADKVLPTEPFSLEKLQAANAEVHLRGEKIVTEQTSLVNMDVHLTVNDGVLKLTPLDFGMAGGNLVAQIELDGRQPRIAARATIVAKGLQLAQLFPAYRLAGAGSGRLGGRAQLAGSGNSIAAMLASANGETGLIMDSGSINELTLRLANLDIAHTIALLVGGDRQTPIRCLVGNFKAVDGDFQIQDLVLDTPKVNVRGSGHLDLRDESLHLTLVPQSKTFSLASLRGPVAVGGTLQTPVVRPEMGNVIARGGLAVVLGALTAGVGTLVPLLDFGKDEDSNCGALIEQAKADAGVKASDLVPRKGK